MNEKDMLDNEVQFQVVNQNQQEQQNVEQLEQLSTIMRQHNAIDYFNRNAIEGKGNLINKMGTVLLAKAFLPTGNHIKQALSYLDMAIKIEIVIYELLASLFWCSLFEILLFIFSMLLFFISPSNMVSIWWHVPHILRGFVGLVLMKKLPNSHQLAANMSIPSNEKMPIETIMSYILRGAEDALTFFTQSSKKWLAIYFFSTTICLFLDFINFFWRIYSFAKGRSAFYDLSLIIISVIFLFINGYYILWVVSLIFKFPTYLTSAIMKGILGMMDSVHQKLGETIKRRKYQTSKQYEQQVKRYDYISQQTQNLEDEQSNEL